MVGMAGKNRGYPVKLLAEHHTDQLVRPGQCAERNHQFGLIAQRLIVTISAADPLNLAGLITAGDRLRAAARHRIVYRDGIPLAVLEGDFVRALTPIDPAIAADVSRALSRRRVTALLR